MAWPLSQDYNEAIQSPQTSFSDPELRAGQPITNVLGIPQPRSGNFADVYEFDCPQSKTRWAVKCFTREVRGLRERYGEISRFLQEVRLPFTVDFQYLEQGLRIRGVWYPLLKMRWVEGLLLNDFVRDNVDKPARLEALSQIWLRMAKRLREAGLAHADLQHGNVILVPGSSAGSLAVKLIDYDGMYVPALASSPSGEVGHPNYQHPQRLKDGIYNAEVDRFPLLVVATALRALTIRGQSLWDRYDNGDNLLFKESDLRAPAQSPLFKELLQIGDSETRSLVMQLQQTIEQPLEQCPLLEEPAPSRATSSAKASSRTSPSNPKMPVAARAGEPDFAFAEKEAAQPRSSSSRMPLLAAGVGGGVILLGLVAGLVAWATSQSPAKQRPGASLAQAKDERGAKKQKKPVTPNTTEPRPSPKAAKTSGEPTPLPNVKEPKKRPEAATADERRFEGHTAPVFAVAFSPDGRQILSGGEDSIVRLWDRDSGKSIRLFTGHKGHVMGVAFSPDGKRIATCASDMTVRLWDPETAKQIGQLEGHRDALKMVTFSPDGRRLLSCGDDKTARLWDVAGQCQLRRFDHPSWVRRALFTADGRHAVTSCEDSHLRVWSLTTGTELRTQPGRGDAYACAVYGDGSRAITGSFDNNLRIYDLGSGQLLSQFGGHSGGVRGLALSPDDRHALTCSTDRTVRLWDLTKGREVKQFPYDCLHTVAFSPDGRFGLCGGQDNVVRLWRLPIEPLPVAPRAAASEPAGDAVEGAEKTVKRRIKAEGAQDSAAEQSALATKLVNQGLQQDDAALRFVYLREGRDIAARAGNFTQSRRAVEEMSFLFGTEELANKTAVLQIAVKSPIAVRASVAIAALEVLADAVAADNYESAEALLALARTAAAKSKDPGLIRLVARSAKRLASLRKEFANVREAAETLARQPENADACLALGKFRCWHKEDWSRGLPLLAAGSNADLATLARKDLADPPAAADQAELGHAWWTLAEKEKGGAHASLRRQARRWLRLALPRLTGQEQVKAADKLKLVMGRFVARPGVVAELFADEELKKRVKTRLDYGVAFNWGFGSPAEGVPADHFSVRWQGWLVAPQKGNYTLFIHADDGARLYLDGKLVIDAWTKIGRHTLPVVLDGTPRRLTIEFREGIGTAMMIFGWIPEGRPEQHVPLEALYHDAQQEKLLNK